ncbi:IgGFc-binding protein [Nannocystis sp.]|uniref:IgGFc-binding protein n=1 Tax=Nannocystis sp. TaxID=1962667 RepID=UPI0025CC50C7|nr:IgGFc-binding protein [Nannocystis sp.]MBK7830642.1 IgGFc-binding protein [Nannocystis sp.]
MTLARLVPVLALALATACADDGRASETSLASTTVVASTSTGDPPTSDPATSTPTSSASTTADPTTAATTTTATTDPLTSSSSGATTCAGPDCDMCQDGETRCTGEVSEICDAGQWLEFELCDPLQGLSCGAQGVCEGSCAAAKLGQSYIGCDFYPTVTSQHDDYNQDPHVFAVTIANTTDIAAKVTITRGDVDVAMTTVDPGSVEAVTLPWVTELSEGPGPSALVIDGAYRLRSDQPVTVYQYNPFAATVSNDASLLIPVNAWGKKIVVASSTEAFDYPSFYAVVAAHDLTTVTLTPSATGKTVLAGGGVMADGSGQLVLDRGDVLQVLTDSGDLTGTVVDADKPVQVIGGSKCLFAPINVFACDHGEESIFPVDTLAKTYVIVPPAQYPNGVQENPQIVRVIASEANTALTFTPDQPVGKLLAAVGDYVELPAGTAKFVVSADKRVLVSQFMASSGSHPAMILAVTPAQWRDDYLVHAPPSWEVNFVDIVAKTGTAVMVDGAAIPPLTAIPGTTYAYTHVKLSNLGDGNHRITGSDKLGISIYGLQTAGSYWYPGGLDLALIPPG